MDQKTYHAEKMYQMSMTIARTMLARGLLTEEELSEIDTIFLEKYRPISSTLSAGKPLLFS